MNGKTIPLSWAKHDVTNAVLFEARKLWNLPLDLRELVNMSVDPEDFHTAESFRHSYWASEMFSKFPFSIEGLDTEAVARQSFEDAEMQCAKTNARLCDLWLRTDVPEGIRRTLRKAQRLLGDLFSGFTSDEIAKHAGWGPGACTSLPARFATPQNKWVLGSHITYGAIPYWDAWVAWTGWDSCLPPTLVPGNRVAFVPKNAKTKRTIAIEPELNSFFQLGLGRAIRARLRRRGLLRPCSQEVHKLLARSGSLEGHLATIDLKSASDTIALALCEALLPASVMDHIAALRSPRGSHDGETWFSYEKVSSMGNGFTFELETALIWAICSAAGGHASVYGDDVIVPISAASWVAEVLDFCGLTMNSKKSHFSATSKFRESCGGHYFAGVDVTPFYVRKPLVGAVRIASANRLRRLGRDQTLPQTTIVWGVMSRGVPRMFRGPEDVASCLHDEWDQCHPRWNSKLQCYEGLGLVLRYEAKQALALGSLRQALYKSPSVIRHPLHYIPLTGDGSKESGPAYQRDPGELVERVIGWKSTGFGYSS